MYSRKKKHPVSIIHELCELLNVFNLHYKKSCWQSHPEVSTQIPHDSISTLTTKRKRCSLIFHLYFFNCANKTQCCQCQCLQTNTQISTQVSSPIHTQINTQINTQITTQIRTQITPQIIHRSVRTSIHRSIHSVVCRTVNRSVQQRDSAGCAISIAEAASVQPGVARGLMGSLLQPTECAP